MGLTVIYRDTAAPALRRLFRTDKAAFGRIRQAATALADDPYPEGAVPWGGSGYWRLHAGDVRVVYQVDEEIGAVYIVNVGIVS